MNSDLNLPDLAQLIAAARKILDALHLALVSPRHELEVFNTTSRAKTFPDFIDFCRRLGKWEIAQMLEACECERWNPFVPRFKFRGPEWECNALSMLYGPELRVLLTQYCGKPPKYLVFRSTSLE